MKHFIIGTAGHVDHGKTSLVKALTGVDCDTHKEEKRRGITINLGFTSLTLSDTLTCGVVDVPGHRDFIHTMVAGVSGIDCALLVIAADGGVMPQTREHVQILSMLGITHGIIVLTRIDCATHEQLAQATSSIKIFATNTFLHNAPIVNVSSKTGQGIPELKQILSAIADHIKPRTTDQIFRMYIDRVFSVSGFGTVVTGSVIGGKLRETSSAWLLPKNKELRVRRLERHGHQVPEVVAGDRASINLAGLDKSDISRGMLVAGHLLGNTNRIDAHISLFTDSPSFGIWSQAIFLMGTFEAQAKIHLLDCNTCTGNGPALVQIHLSSHCNALYGDRFILRSCSSDRTFGGGVVLDAAPHNHRRRTPHLINSLKDLSTHGLPALIRAHLKKMCVPQSAQAIAESLNCTEQQVNSVLKDLPSSISILTTPTQSYFCGTEELAHLCSAIVGELAEYHVKNPLKPTGRTLEELTGIVSERPGILEAGALNAVLVYCAARNEIKQVGQTWALAGHLVIISTIAESQAAVVVDYIKGCGMQAPLPLDLTKKASGHGIGQKDLKQILGHLISTGVVYPAGDTFLDAKLVDTCKIKLIEKYRANGNGFTVAEFRDLIGGNRKICLLMLEVFDKQGVTVRNGDVRIVKD